MQVIETIDSRLLVWAMGIDTVDDSLLPYRSWFVCFHDPKH